jgi:glutathione S-transferase
MPTLYGVYRSRMTRNAWLMLELGQELEIVPVIQAYRLPDPKAPDAPMNTLTPEFLALAPQGAIPVLSDGDLVLSESLAINLYLAKLHGGPLAPATLAEDALMTQWALYGMTAIEPAALKLFYARTNGLDKTEAGRAEIAGYVAGLQRPLAAVETHLAAHGQMVGDRFTVADVNMAECIRYATAEPGLLDPFPAIAGWLAACHARPAFQEMWARRAAEPA